MTMLTHREMTAHIRKRLKQNGIKAKCSLYMSCGIKYIRISMSPELFFGSREWKSEEAFKIAQIASANKLTGARNAKIDPYKYEKYIGQPQFDFEFWG